MDKYSFLKKLNFLNIKKAVLALAFMMLPVCFFSEISFVSAQTVFWDSPQTLVSGDSRFPRTINLENESYVFWEKVINKNEIALFSKRFDANGTYPEVQIGTTFSYSGEVPDMFTVAASPDGKIVVVAIGKERNPDSPDTADEHKGLTIFTCYDKGETFKKETRSPVSTSESVFIAPRVYYSANGQFRLFVSYSKNNAFYLMACQSSNGKIWSTLMDFSPSVGLKNPFVPVQLATPQGDYVVFQAQYLSESTGRFSYQLYGTFTADGGDTWSKAKLITDKNSQFSNDRKNFALYANQRPNLYYYENEVYLVWERTENINSSIWLAKITKDGIVPKTVDRLSEQGNASRAIPFVYNNDFYIGWFDTSSGKESVYMSKKDGVNWKKTTLVQNSDSNLFPHPVLTKNKADKQDLAFVWQRESTKTKKNTLYFLGPDRTVAKAKLVPVSFKEGKRGTAKKVEIRIKFPEDSSGIAGYSYTWGKENQEIPPETIQSTTKNSVVNLIADGDGVYNLIVRVQDKAGNWSKESSISYHRDLTPPGIPVINPLQLDKYGLYASNNVKVTWTAPEDDDVAGYNYTFERLGNIPKNLTENKTHKITLSKNQVQKEISALEERYKSKVEKNTVLKSNVITKNKSSKTYNNYENGVYLFSVSAIDEVGNVSSASKVLVFINKYRPSTFISEHGVTLKENELGELEAEISGGGFTYEGSISQIYIDLDGKAPYDKILYRDKGDFTIKSNKLISNIKLGTELDEGRYKIGLLHTDRGLYMSPKPVLSITQTGTLKIESDYEIKKNYTVIENIYKYSLPISVVLIVLLIALVFAIIQSIVVYTIQGKAEKIIIQKEINALITGEDLPMAKQKKKNKRQKSLRGKLVGFTIILVIVVVALISLENGNTMIETQKEDLTEGLNNRIEVLLDSLVSGVENYLPTENPEIKFIVDQRKAVPEVEYVTILGPNLKSVKPEAGDTINYVWASDDPDIKDKVTHFDQYGIESGVSKILSEEELGLIQKYADINEKSKIQVQEISEKIIENQLEHRSLQTSTDEESRARLQAISQEITTLRSEIKDKLHAVAKENAGTAPFFSIETLGTYESYDYLFYRPVLYREGSSENYLHGLIIVKVSTQELIQTLQHSIKIIIITALIIAFAAILVGAIGSLILASIIVKPIRKLESQLVEIGSIMTKSARERMRLSKKKINIKSRDEIGHLGEVVNSMTDKLGRAAEDEYLNLDGKKVQECFIPLKTGENGFKIPVVKLNEEKLDLFAFYKGDSSVSGDYFDYKKLDDHWYVFVKCDVSGHGEPAALLVSVVATKFKEMFYFGDWKPAAGPALIKRFVTNVNDFIFELGTRGKFSTINISLYNKDTGELYFCNAGDNKIHILEKASRKFKEITLANLPTAGGISTEVVEMTAGGYKVEKVQLNHGDILYLYTDGIDEAERLVRDHDFNIKQTVKEEKKFNRETRKEEIVKQVLDEKEQFGPERIAQVLEAYANKTSFVLEKQDNPVHEVLEFDFSTCGDDIDQSIIALAAIERVFRMVKTPDVQPGDEIEIETVVDNFLKEHFNLYSKYCMPLQKSADGKKKKSKKKGSEEDDNDPKIVEDPNLTRYSSIIEDKQADDITMIAIRRP